MSSNVNVGITELDPSVDNGAPFQFLAKPSVADDADTSVFDESTNSLAVSFKQGAIVRLACEVSVDNPFMDFQNTKFKATGPSAGAISPVNAATKFDGEWWLPAGFITSHEDSSLRTWRLSFNVSTQDLEVGVNNFSIVYGLQRDDIEPVTCNFKVTITESANITFPEGTDLVNEITWDKAQEINGWFDSHTISLQTESDADPIQYNLVYVDRSARPDIIGKEKRIRVDKPEGTLNPGVATVVTVQTNCANLGLGSAHWVNGEMHLAVAEDVVEIPASFKLSAGRPQIRPVGNSNIWVDFAAGETEKEVTVDLIYLDLWASQWTRPDGFVEDYGWTLSVGGGAALGSGQGTFGTYANSSRTLTFNVSDGADAELGTAEVAISWTYEGVTYNDEITIKFIK